MSRKIRCPICEKEFQGDTFDNCPFCDWCYQGFEDNIEQDEYSSINHTTIAKAKDNLSKGLNIWGKPLQKNKTKLKSRKRRRKNLRFYYAKGLK